MTELALVRTEDGWRLPLEGCVVSQCCVDWAVTLRLDHPVGAFELRIEQPFRFAPAAGGEVLLDPEHEPTGLGPVLVCARTSVHEAVAFDDGRVVVSFANSSSIWVPSSSDYEAWGLTGPRGLRVVSLPGGDLTVWQPEVDS